MMRRPAECKALRASGSSETRPPTARPTHAVPLQVFERLDGAAAGAEGAAAGSHPRVAGGGAGGAAAGTGTPTARGGSGGGGGSGRGRREFYVVVHVLSDHAFKKYGQHASRSDLPLLRGLLLKVTRGGGLGRGGRRGRRLHASRWIGRSRRTFA